LNKKKGKETNTYDDKRNTLQNLQYDIREEEKKRRNQAKKLEILNRKLNDVMQKKRLNDDDKDQLKDRDFDLNKEYDERRKQVEDNKKLIE